MRKTITKLLERSKIAWETSAGDAVIIAIVLLTGFFGFGLGRLSKIEETKTPITFEDMENRGMAFTGQTSNTNDSSLAASVGNLTKNGQIVASKNGTKYHFSWCPGARSIKPENKITFDSKEQAEKAGYSRASNCK